MRITPYLLSLFLIPLLAVGETVTPPSTSESAEQQSRSGEIAATTEAESTADSVDLPGPLSTLDQLQQAMVDAEAEGGAYSPKVGELMYSLGINQREGQEYDKAIETFRRGMHIDKVNNGITSINQVPYLEQIATTENMRADAEAATDALAYVNWIYEQNFGPYSPQIIDPLLRLANQHQQMATGADYEQDLLHLQYAHRYLQRAAMIAERELEKNPVKQQQIYLGLTNINWELAKFLKDGEGARRGSGFTFNIGNQTVPENQQLSVLSNSYQSGKGALMANLKTVELMDAPAESAAEATALLADWHLLFGRRQTATATYQIAYEHLSKLDNPEPARERIFHNPVPIPLFDDNAGIEQNPALATGSSDASSSNAETASRKITFRMSINKYGFPRQIEVIESPDSLSQAELDQAISDVKNTRFRPRLEDGRLVYSDDVMYTLNMRQP